jgi:hypothetical protein
MGDRTVPIAEVDLQPTEASKADGSAETFVILRALFKAVETKA